MFEPQPHFLDRMLEKVEDYNPSGQVPASIDTLTEHSYEQSQTHEHKYSETVQKLRKRMWDLLKKRNDEDIILRPYQKPFKGENIENFRGSKWRGISKNGNAWQILVMVDRKKLYLGTLNTDIDAAKFYDKVTI